MKRAAAFLLVMSGAASADKVAIEGTLGSLDQEAVQSAVDAAAGSFDLCFRSQAEKFRHLGGQAHLLIRVARDGNVRRAQIDAGDLGSWAAEKCILSTAREMVFSKPKGGEAQVEVPLQFISFSPADAGEGDELAGKLTKALSGCSGAPKGGAVTAYVGPGGRIKSAGFTGEVSDGWGDCAAKKLATLRLRDPRGRMLKVTANLP